MFQSRPIGWDFRISTDLLLLDIEPIVGKQMMLRQSRGRVTILCPEDWMNEGIKFQGFLRNVIRNALQNQAKAIFPQRLARWSDATGLHYNRLGIHKTRSKWGSYSSLGNLNLSVYLLLLDVEYLDYTICHELCHSKEMNHSDRFWNLLNHILSKDARAVGRAMNRLVRNWYDTNDPRYLLISNL